MNAENKLAAGLAAVGTRHTSSPAAAAVAPTKYEDRTRRATFHVDIEVLNEVEAASRRTGLSKAKIVNEALRRYLRDLR